MTIEQVRTPVAARRVAAEGRTVVLHATQDWIERLRAGQVDFFRKLAARMTQEGMPFRFALHGGSSSNILLGQNHVHLMVGTGPAYGPNILHAHPGYVWGFWYLDETGIRWNSSIRLARFNPAEIDGDKATYFFNGVTSHMLRENVSVRAQAPRQAGGLEPARAVIFCQDIENRPDRSHFLGTEAMIRTTAETLSGELVYLKLHPEQARSMRAMIMQVAQDYPNIRLADASVHDLNAAADVVVTQNSTAGFEALMQRKTVITCGRSDYWHATLTPRTTADLREALVYGRDAMRGFSYERYLYWFLDRRCLEPGRPEFASRAWARIRDKAYL